MSIKFPHSRKFPPRTSQEELKAKVADELTKKGVYNHMQAQFYEATSHIVVGSENFEYSVLQPNLKTNTEEEEWQMAYEFIFDFLEKNKMDLTLSAINTEFGDMKDKPIHTDTFDSISREQYFEDLISLPLSSESFAKRVEEFAEKEEI